MDARNMRRRRSKCVMRFASWKNSTMEDRTQEAIKKLEVALCFHDAFEDETQSNFSDNFPIKLS